MDVQSQSSSDAVTGCPCNSEGTVDADAASTERLMYTPFMSSANVASSGFGLLGGDFGLQRIVCL